MKATLFGLIASIGIAAASPAFAQTAGERAVNVGGPGLSHLVLEYKSDPRRMVAFRKYMQGPGVARFRQWKAEGILSGFKILLADHSLKPLPDMYVILDFAHFADIERWQQIEKALPAGLDAEGLALAEPISTIYSDIPWTLHTPGASHGKSVYMMIPYTVLSTMGQYQDFVNKYVTPQTKGWVKSGILLGYDIHLNQNPLKATWDSLLVFEYRDMSALAMRDIVKQQVRDQIQETPGYKQYSPIKTTVRDEHQPGLYEDVSG